MKDLKNTENLYEYILRLSTYDINKMVENAKSDDEKKILFKIGRMENSVTSTKINNKRSILMLNYVIFTEVNGVRKSILFDLNI